MTGPLLISWTIRLALMCYALMLAVDIAAVDRKRWWPISRLLWSAGGLLFVVHLICAFHFFHDWSHWHALAHTADETERLLGFRFGEGIYFSYVFTLLWVIDIAWWWADSVGYLRRSKRLNLAIHAYMFFIAFNGAIVFEDGPTRYAGIVACLGLGLLLAWRVLAKKGQTNQQQPAVVSQFSASEDQSRADA